MIQAVLFGVSLLPTVARPISAGPDGLEIHQRAEPGIENDQARVLTQYNERRDKALKTAELQWRPALWCEQNGFDAEVEIHLTNVVRLDPGRDVA